VDPEMIWSYTRESSFPCVVKSIERDIVSDELNKGRKNQEEGKEGRKEEDGRWDDG